MIANLSILIILCLFCNSATADRQTLLEWALELAQTRITTEAAYLDAVNRSLEYATLSRIRAELREVSKTGDATTNHSSVASAWPLNGALADRFNFPLVNQLIWERLFTLVHQRRTNCNEVARLSNLLGDSLNLSGHLILLEKESVLGIIELAFAQQETSALSCRYQIAQSTEILAALGKSNSHFIHSILLFDLGAKKYVKKAEQTTGRYFDYNQEYYYYAGNWSRGEEGTSQLVETRELSTVSGKPDWRLKRTHIRVSPQFQATTRLLENMELRLSLVTELGQGAYPAVLGFSLNNTMFDPFEYSSNFTNLEANDIKIDIDKLGRPNLQWALPQFHHILTIAELAHLYGERSLK